jgi:hypothetical protein
MSFGQCKAAALLHAVLQSSTTVLPPGGAVPPELSDPQATNQIATSTEAQPRAIPFIRISSK